ncbi:hypothetical protein C8R43DRAFT_944936 [Mycena crocata]|nr:hypothetical protein C8R43DRAFT_944936 [Mycena crocata]
MAKRKRCCQKLALRHYLIILITVRTTLSAIREDIVFIVPDLPMLRVSAKNFELLRRAPSLLPHCEYPGGDPYFGPQNYRVLAWKFVKLFEWQTFKHIQIRSTLTVYVEHTSTFNLHLPLSPRSRILRAPQDLRQPAFDPDSRIRLAKGDISSSLKDILRA